MDVSSGFDIPNPYGLPASEFGYDMDAYRTALKFLSDLAGGSEQSDALERNGGTAPMLTLWQRSSAFRRVYGKCLTVGRLEREARERRDADANEDDGAEVRVIDGYPIPPPGQQMFVRLEDLPARRTVFNRRAPESFGSGSMSSPAPAFSAASSGIGVSRSTAASGAHGEGS